MPKVLTRKIIRNRIRNKYSNKAVNSVFQNYQQAGARGKKYSERDIEKAKKL
jgi:hypothetical protein